MDDVQPADGTAVDALFGALQKLQTQLTDALVIASDSQALLQQKFDAGYAKGLVDQKAIDDAANAPAPVDGMFTQAQLDAKVAEQKAADDQVLADKVAALKDAAKAAINKLKDADDDDAAQAVADIDAL